MGFWGVRAGSGGEREQFALENNCVVVGWDEAPDLESLQNRDSIRKILARRIREPRRKRWL